MTRVLRATICVSRVEQIFPKRTSKLHRGGRCATWRRCWLQESRCNSIATHTAMHCSGAVRSPTPAEGRGTLAERESPSQHAWALLGERQAPDPVLTPAPDRTPTPSSGRRAVNPCARAPSSVPARFLVTDALDSTLCRVDARVSCRAGVGKLKCSQRECRPSRSTSWLSR